MTRKLLLFAILSPLAIQPETRANALTSFVQGVKNVVMPWRAEATRKNAHDVNFNDWVDLVTLGLTFGNVLYTTAFPAFRSNLRDARAKVIDKFAADDNTWWSLPYLLIVHDLYKSIGTLHEKSDKKLKLALSTLKIFANLGLKGAPRLFGTK